MSLKKIFHLVNGQVMYNYFKENHIVEEEWMAPFNEAMCFGDTCEAIFSPPFNQIRADVHHVTLEQYTEITLNPLKPLFSENDHHLSLWFDRDMFCQINLLTVLAWLDQKDYKGSVEVNLVDQRFEVEDKFTLQATGYHTIYKEVLIEKKSPEQFIPEPLKTGITLYLNYLKNDSDLMRYIEKYEYESDEQLVIRLIRKFHKYGLGDTQYLEIIKSYRKK